MNRFRIPAAVLTACLVTPLLFAQTTPTAQDQQTATQPADQTPASTATKPANNSKAIDLSSEAAAKEEKKEARKKKKNQALEQAAQTAQASQAAGKPTTSVYPIDPANGSTKPTPADSGGSAVPVAAPPDAAQKAEAEKKEEKKEAKKEKKKAAKDEEGDKLPAGMVVGKLIYSVAAERPPMARSAHITGSVTLKATVEPDGSVKHIKAISGPPMLQQAAIDAASQWKYSPYLLNGQPTAAPTTITINFK